MVGIGSEEGSKYIPAIFLYLNILFVSSHLFVGFSGKYVS